MKSYKRSLQPLPQLKKERTILIDKNGKNCLNYLHIFSAVQFNLNIIQVSYFLHLKSVPEISRSHSPSLSVLYSVYEVWRLFSDFRTGSVLFKRYSVNVKEKTSQ